jgi:hypothetical protein
MVKAAGAANTNVPRAALTSVRIQATRAGFRANSRFINKVSTPENRCSGRKNERYEML